MKALLSFLHLLVYSNLWVAVCAATLAGATPYIVGEPFDFPSFLLVLSATLFSYNIQRLNRLPKDEQQESPSVMVRWIIDNKKLVYGFTVLGLIGTIISVFFINWEIILVLMPLGFISMAYTVKVAFQKSGRQGLRDIPGLKIFLIAITWVGATAVVPILQVKGVEYAKELDFWLINAHRLLFVLAITIPFDVRDLKYDEPGKKTLPQVFGEKISLGLAVFLLWGAAALQVMGTYQFIEVAGPKLIVVLCFSVFATVLILLSSKKRHDLHYTFNIEGLSLLLAGSLWVIAEYIGY